MTRRWLAAAAMVALAGSTWAGTVFKAIQKGEGKSAQPQDMALRVFAEGNKARFEFEQSANPMMPKGSYALSLDGGKTIRMVNPTEKQVMDFDLGAMAGMARSMVSMEIKDVKVEQLLDEAGPQIRGYDTRHYKFRMALAMEVSVMGQSHVQKIEQETELWVAPKLADVGFAAWGQTFEFKTGKEAVDAGSGRRRRRSRSRGCRSSRSRDRPSTSAAAPRPRRPPTRSRTSTSRRSTPPSSRSRRTTRRSR